MAAKNGAGLTFNFPELKPDERLRELILYVSEQCASDPKFGATKLNKILYFSDFISFAERGKPITGAEYMRLGKGPVPKRLVPVREELRKAKHLEVKVADYYGHDQKRPIAKRQPDLKSFAAEDISIVDRVIRLLWDKTAEECSDLSHGVAWNGADNEESIPYEAAYMSDEALTQDDLNAAQEMIAQLA